MVENADLLLIVLINYYYEKNIFQDLRDDKNEVMVVSQQSR
jgi:hypothetical protein